MRVLIFSTAYFPFIGGAEVAVKEITDRLGDEIGFDLITARLKRGLPSVEKVGKVTVYRMGIGVPLIDKFFLPYCGAWKAWRLHGQNNYDYFWGIMASFATGALYIVNIFRSLLGRMKVLTVLTLQEGDSEEYLKSKWLGLINLSWRLALKRTDVLTGLSNYLLERAKRLGYTGTALLIPNGVDVERFSNPQSRIFNPDQVVLITTSRLNVKNGVGDLIAALTPLPESVMLKIVGVGELEKSLKAKVRKLKLEDRVEFAGLVSQEKIPNYLHHADIFVRPSLSEGQGISFIEAMAAGLPVVATPVGGIPDFLQDGETGVFCRPRDPQSIAQAVKRLIDDAALRERVVKNALQMVKEKYDWDLIAQDMKNQVFEPFY